MVKISAVIITFNEERNISRCIDSVKDIADEILVADSYSTDKTKQICIEKGVRFVEHAFEGHIEQKNWAITQATNRYVLSLDADEALNDPLRKSILEVKNNWTHDGYSFNRLTNYCGKWIRHCGWYPDVKLRLWNSEKGCWDGENPHDKYMMDEGATIKHLEGDLLHYSFYTIAQHVAQVNKFTDISSNTLFKKGKKASFIKIFFAPKWKFFRDFIFKGGFADGYYGYVICKISAHAKYLKYSKLRELHKNA